MLIRISLLRRKGIGIHASIFLCYKELTGISNIRFFITTDGVKAKRCQSQLCMLSCERKKTLEVMDFEQNDAITDWSFDPGVRSLVMMSNSAEGVVSFTTPCIIDFQFTINPIIVKPSQPAKTSKRATTCPRPDQ